MFKMGLRMRAIRTKDRSQLSDRNNVLCLKRSFILRLVTMTQRQISMQAKIVESMKFSLVLVDVQLNVWLPEFLVATSSSFVNLCGSPRNRFWL